MTNCLASKAHDDFVGHKSLSAPCIWSLRRNADRRSILDVEVYFQEALQVRGPANNKPGPGAARQLQHLVSRYARAGLRLEFRTACKIVIGPDGESWRRDKAPPHLVAALIAEAKSRLLSARAQRRRMLDDADLILSLETDYDAALVVWQGGRAAIGGDVQVRQ